MNKYTNEKNALILISLLKKFGIRKVVASPGNTNTAFVGSVQNDDFFEVYSVVDERSAGYFAVGLAAATDEPVIVSCTGATASRNYLPALTEAFYRKIPVLAITSSQKLSRCGHLHAQFIDRSVVPNDVVRKSFTLPVVKDQDDFWDCEVKVNSAIWELTNLGGGPVHINIPTTFEKPFGTSELPNVRKIQKVFPGGKLPEVTGKKVAVFLGSRKQFSNDECLAVEKFCKATGAVVFTDHTSGYSGKFSLNFSLIAGQEYCDLNVFRPDILIQMGEVSGDYFSLKLAGKEVWRVCLDGEIRDTFKKLRCVFVMSDKDFMNSYSNPSQNISSNKYFEVCSSALEDLKAKIPDLPFSNLWVARFLSEKLPPTSHIHFGILNSLRCWNFFSLPAGVTSSSNVGGFGIDGPLSTFVGESLSLKSEYHYCVLGDLAFFYDINILGNRHLPSNLRILLINNGEGFEFRQYNHHAYMFGDSASKFISAAGHNGSKSKTLVKSFVESLGFAYVGINDKSEFISAVPEMVSQERQEKPVVFEIFSTVEEEGDALRMVLNLAGDNKVKAKRVLKSMAKSVIKKI